MKERVNMYLDEMDRKICHFLKERYGLDSEAAVVRYLIRKAAKDESYTEKKTGKKKK